MSDSSAKKEGAGKGMTIHLKIWRQARGAAGARAIGNWGLAQGIARPGDESRDGLLALRINQSINRPINQSANQPIHGWTD